MKYRMGSLEKLNYLIFIRYYIYGLDRIELLETDDCLLDITCTMIIISEKNPWHQKKCTHISPLYICTSTNCYLSLYQVSLQYVLIRPRSWMWRYYFDVENSKFKGHNSLFEMGIQQSHYNMHTYTLWSFLVPTKWNPYENAGQVAKMKL
jgi:hypothetical protein